LSITLSYIKCKCYSTAGSHFHELPVLTVSMLGVPDIHSKNGYDKTYVHEIHLKAVRVKSSINVHCAHVILVVNQNENIVEHIV